MKCRWAYKSVASANAFSSICVVWFAICDLRFTFSFTHFDCLFNVLCVNLWLKPISLTLNVKYICGNERERRDRFWTENKIVCNLAISEHCTSIYRPIYFVRLNFFWQRVRRFSLLLWKMMIKFSTTETRRIQLTYNVYGQQETFAMASTKMSDTLNRHLMTLCALRFALQNTWKMCKKCLQSYSIKWLIVQAGKLLNLMCCTENWIRLVWSIAFFYNTDTMTE